MPTDPYGAGLLKPTMFPAKRPVEGVFVVVSSARLVERRLELIAPRTRCVTKHEIHEIIVSEEVANPGGVVNEVAYWGFFETIEGGVLQVGDDVMVNGTLMGRIAGFDVSHAPNHFNVVLHVKRAATGLENNFAIGDRIVFQLPIADADGRSSSA